MFWKSLDVVIKQLGKFSQLPWERSASSRMQAKIEILPVAAIGTALLLLFDCPWPWLLLWFAAGLVLYQFARWWLVVPWMLIVGATVCSFLLRTHPGATDYRTQLGSHSRYAVLQLQVTDWGLTSQLAMPKSIRGEVRKIGFPGEEHSWHQATGTILFQLPPDAPRVSYGDEIELAGTLRLPQSAALYHWEQLEILPEAGLGSFQNYLKIRNIGAIFYADQVQIISSGAGWDDWLYQQREWLLDKALQGVSDPENRKLIAALFFGCRTGLSDSSRLEQIRSGTIHIFAVSGLHVAVFAGLLLLLLSQVPFRVRYLLVLGLVFAFVVTTGSNVPAMRAFFMIGCWCVLRIFLLRIPNREVLAGCAALLIAFNPFYLFDPGFLYSFLITALLILMAEYSGQWGQLLLEKRHYIAPPVDKKRLFKEETLRVLFTATASCVIAFLGGCVISLMSYGTFYPGSVAANLAMLPVMALLFPVMMVKLCLWFVPGVNVLLGWILSILFDLFQWIAAATAAAFGSTNAEIPHWSLAVIFYLALFLLFIPNRKALAVSLITLTSLLIFWHLRPDFKPAALLIAHTGSEDVPSFTIVEPAASFAVTIQLNHSANAALVEKFLLSRGVKQLDQLVIASNRKYFHPAIARFTARLPVGELILLEHTPPGSRRKNLLQVPGLPSNLPVTTVRSNDETLVLNRGIWQIFQKKQQMRIEYFNPCSMVNVKIIYDPENQSVTWTRPDGTAARLDLPSSNIMEVFEYEL